MSKRAVLALTASGFPQKVIAMKLGLAPSTMSETLQRAHKRLGFSSLGQLLRSYGASRKIIDFEENEASVAKEMTIDGADTLHVRATVY